MKHFFFSLLLLLPLAVASQDPNFWDTLANVRFENRKDKSGYDVEVPVFSPQLSAFHKKKITLKGYIIPLEELGGQGRFMLSALPFNLCFFCGAAGPETVVEVETSLKIPFTAKPIVMEGILLLNDKDPNHHMYILSAAKRLH